MRAASLRGQRWLAPIAPLAVDCGSRGRCPGSLPETFSAVPRFVSNPAGSRTAALGRAGSLRVYRAGLREPNRAVNVAISCCGAEAELLELTGGEGGEEERAAAAAPPGFFHPKARRPQRENGLMSASSSVFAISRVSPGARMKRVHL